MKKTNNLRKKIIVPKKLNKKNLYSFFNKLKLNKLISISENNIPLKVNEIVSKNLPEYPPMLEDLYRLYQFTTLNKRTTILEFGSGWSTLILFMALSQNKNNFISDVKRLRRNNAFEIFSVENKKKYLQKTKEKLNKFAPKNLNLKAKINLIYSEVYMDKINDRYCTKYKNLPLCNPDLIYLDGPNLFSTKNKINNFTVDHKDLMPMVGDIIRFENFLTPGTIIITDGRSANAQFLNDNFKRNWLYEYDEDFDQHLFYLDAKSLGKWNNLQLKFYKNNI